MKFIKTKLVKSPSRGTPESAGLDFYVPEGEHGESIIIQPGESVNIPSGIKMILPRGKAGIFFNKSGVGVKGVIVGACVVDSDYRGEVHLNVHNVSNKEVEFRPGQKLVQMLILDVNLVDVEEITDDEFASHSNTIRGSGGFGSTGA